MAAHSGKTAAALLRGLIAAVLLTLLGMLALAAWVVWGGLGDQALTVLNQVLKIVGIGTGVLAAVGPGGHRGLPMGACLGLIYIALGYGLCSLWGDLLVTPKALTLDLLLGLAVGGLWGTLFANLPARRTAKS